MEGAERGGLTALTELGLPRGDGFKAPSCSLTTEIVRLSMHPVWFHRVWPGSREGGGEVLPRSTRLYKATCGKAMWEAPTGGGICRE